MSWNRTDDLLAVSPPNLSIYFLHFVCVKVPSIFLLVKHKKRVYLGSFTPKNVNLWKNGSGVRPCFSWWNARVQKLPLLF